MSAAAFEMLTTLTMTPPISVRTSRLRFTTLRFELSPTSDRHAIRVHRGGLTLDVVVVRAN